MFTNNRDRIKLFLCVCFFFFMLQNCCDVQGIDSEKHSVFQKVLMYLIYLCQWWSTFSGFFVWFHCFQYSEKLLSADFFAFPSSSSESLYHFYSWWTAEQKILSQNLFVGQDQEGIYKLEAFFLTCKVDMRLHGYVFSVHYLLIDLVFLPLTHSSITYESI